MKKKNKTKQKENQLSVGAGGGSSLSNPSLYKRKGNQGKFVEAVGAIIFPLFLT